MIKHVVFMKFKAGVTEKDIADLEKAMAKLPGRIPEIKEYQFGRDIVRSERSYDFALVSAFEDLDGAEALSTASGPSSRSREGERRYVKTFWQWISKYDDMAALKNFPFAFRLVRNLLMN